MARKKGVTTKSIYVEVSDDTWAKIKITCFNQGITLKEFITRMLNKVIK
jgi:predicted DNA binding CopG/RHH family protein